ncbi:condensation domain-containing protein, partial [Streptomyces sp. NPDC088846]|uniref:condensation domain-containing protein n=1 Tax=Streptomyces sp. NPDC088846 TaxID=3365908 RepID=UPI003823EE70
RTPTEELLTHIWTNVLGTNHIGIHDNFFELGGDSILSIQVITRAGRLGLKITPPQMFQHPTVEGLAAEVAPHHADQVRPTGSVPLTPYQRSLIDEEHAGRDLRGLTYLLATDSLEPDLLGAALEIVGGHHDALRLRCERSGDDWHQFLTDEDPVTRLHHHDLAGETEESAHAQIALGTQRIQASLDVCEGPLLQGALFEMCGGKGQRLLLVAHPLVADESSWGILLEDLAVAYQALKSGRKPVLPIKTTSFAEWARLQEELAQSPEPLSESSYWVPSGRPDAARADRSTNGSASRAAVEVRLGVEGFEADTRTSGHELQARINELALTALERAIRDSLGDRPGIEITADGRDHPLQGADLSRSVGCFSFSFPLKPPAVEHGDLRAALAETEVRLSGIPSGGIGHGLLRFGGPTETREALAATRPAVGFHFGRKTQESFEGLGGRTEAVPCDPSPTSPTRSSSARFVIELQGKEMSLDLGCASDLYDEATMGNLVRKLREYVTELAGMESGPDQGVQSASEFPLSGLDQEALASVLERFSK